MIKKYLKSLVDSDNKEGCSSITTNTGEIFPNPTLLEYEENKDGDHISFYCTQTETYIYEEDFDSYEHLQELIDEGAGESNSKVIKYVWKVDQIAGIGMVTLDLSKGFSDPT